MIFLVSGVCIVTIFVFSVPKKKINAVYLGQKAFSVEIADTNTSRAHGLSGHAPLSDNTGMFFVFPTDGNYGFWMKDMTFSLDIIWIDSNFKITHIENSLAPETFPKVFYPESDTLPLWFDNPIG